MALEVASISPTHTEIHMSQCSRSFANWKNVVSVGSTCHPGLIPVVEGVIVPIRIAKLMVRGSLDLDRIACDHLLAST